MGWNNNSTVKISEDDLQRQCISWFKWQHKAFSKRILAIPNGGKRDVVTAVKMKQTGTLAGAWDIFLSIPRNGYGGLYIEMKSGKNGLTDLQKEFQEANKEDYGFEVCRTLEEFQAAIKRYLFVNQLRT